MAAVPPANCARTNTGTDVQSMPANVFVSVRPMVTAGLAKLVDEVNQYAAAMYPATANGTVALRPDRTIPTITISNPNVATTSLTARSAEDRTWVDIVTASR